MKGSNKLAGCDEVLIKRLRECDRFVKEYIRKTVGLGGAFSDWLPAGTQTRCLPIAVLQQLACRTPL
jgi:hypothetical protein